MRRLVATLGLAALAALGAACSSDGNGSPDDSAADAPTTASPATTGSPANTGSPATTGSPAGSVSRPSASLELLEPAVAAVEAERGGPQRYTEINVQTDLVNLFVALDDGTELAYVYRADGLDVPTEAQAQPGGAEPFALDDVPLDVVATFDDVLAAEVPDSALVALTLAPRPESGLVWTATLLSTQGGVLDVLISPNGAILGAAPR